MNTKDIQELIMIVNSVENSKKLYNRQYEFTPQVITRCEDFCSKHNIRITHGSAYKELRHKSYYYKNKHLQSVINEGIDLYNLRQNHIVKDSDIVDKLIKTRKINKLYIENGKIGIYK